MFLKCNLIYLKMLANWNLFKKKAKGPSFKKHFQGDPMNLVDIYQMYAHVLGFEPVQFNLIDFFFLSSFI